MVAAAKALSNREFLERVRDYLPVETFLCAVDALGQPARAIAPRELQENVFYAFDADALVAFSHAIEDLALDRASGRLVAVVQDFQHFAPHRERYWQLAATIDETMVIGGGRKPPRNGRLRYCPVKQPALSLPWGILYQGRRARAMVLGRQTNSARRFEDKRFIGFYTFHSKVIERVRHELEDLAEGSSDGLSEFERLLAIDRAEKQVEAQFNRSKAGVISALHKLQRNGSPPQTRQFVAEFNASLEPLVSLPYALGRFLDGETSEPLHD